MTRVVSQIVLKSLFQNKNNISFEKEIGWTRCSVHQNAADVLFFLTVHYEYLLLEKEKAC